MEEKQYVDYFMINNTPHNFNEDNKKNKSVHIDVPNYKAFACIALGWLGLSIIATIFSLLISIFIEIPEPGTAEYVKLLGWMNFASYTVTAIFLISILGKNIFLKILKQFKGYNVIGKGLMYGLLLLSASIAYNMIVLTLYPDFGANQNQNAVVDMIVTMPVVSFISVVILAPLTEEITYRLCLTGSLAKKSKFIGIVVSSVLFGLIHSAFIDLSFLEMDKQAVINELIALPSYIISGLIMAIAYTKEDSLACSITAHMTNNFVAFVQSFIADDLIESVMRIF